MLLLKTLCELRIYSAVSLFHSDFCHFIYDWQSALGNYKSGESFSDSNTDNFLHCI
jgi:hypothetical protein